MVRNNTASYATDRELGDEKRIDKPTRLKAKKDSYREDWEHMRRISVVGRVYDGVLHSDGDATGYSPYYDVDDYVSREEIDMIECTILTKKTLFFFQCQHH